MNFIEAPTTWAVIESQHLLLAYNKATCRVAAGLDNNNGWNKCLKKDEDNNSYNYGFYPQPRLYTKLRYNFIPNSQFHNWLPLLNRI